MLDKERDTPCRDGRVIVVPVAADTKIFAGSIAAINASGYAVPASDTAGLKVAGRAETTVDNTDGDAGDKSIEIASGCFLFDITTLSGAKPGSLLYVVDDEEVALAAGSHSVFAGVLEETGPDTDGWVRMGLDVPPPPVVVPIAGAVVAVAASAAPTQGATYAQADVQAVADLANESKTKLNAVIAALKTAGLMTA
jgi:hypothetical protein